MSQSPYRSAVHEALATFGLIEKTAARAGIKRLRQLLATSDKAQVAAAANPALRGAANEAHQAYKALEGHAPKIMAGRQAAGIRPLGGGAEGVAHHMLGPQGEYALKIHDPTTEMFSPKLIEAKQQLVGKNVPHMARINEAGTMPGTVGGHAAPSFKSEYVHGVSGGNANPEQLRDIFSAQKQMMHYDEGGHGLYDFHRGNFKVTPEGKPVAFDAMVVPSHELLPGAERGDVSALEHSFKDFYNSSTLANMNAGKIDKPVPLRTTVAPANHADMLEAAGGGTPEMQAWANNENSRLDKHYLTQLTASAYKPGYQPKAYTPAPMPMPAAKPASATPSPSTEGLWGGQGWGQPVASSRPVAQPVASSRPVAQPVASSRPVAQPVASSRPVAQPSVENIDRQQLRTPALKLRPRPAGA